ncbi:TonB-dependent receptor [Catenovulum sp. 2E275]|uniref:TonB-dependent receptor n=1 Tax=Catenovulum sp. 2E275 TaxID=2980497 RepID=UPI0021CF71B9|nr:TonB-dependent receptor [Catenovulum sp. 2E275]MCU4674094.1 TonB-dependent receptor [Catenovulum sp. 2E275]
MQHCKQAKFNKRLIAASITASLMAGTSFNLFAEEAQPAEQVETINVKGVRGSVIKSIFDKRNATSIVDAISSEDIGKLPDVTISDSLQRITGVQIRRSAGEGSTISIRGLPQVVTTLNGEQYIGASSVTSTQPNFNDIPSQLFKGASVIKSPTATNVAAGITGSVNLKTYRPFDFQEDLTIAVAGEVQHGLDSDEYDPSANLLVSYREDKWGFLTSVSYQTVNLANYFNGRASDEGWTGLAGEGWAFPSADHNLDTDNDGNLDGFDANGDGDLNDQYVAFQGHTAYNRINERERLGLNSSFQADLGEGFTLNADLFYTNMEENQRSAGFAHSDKWTNWGYFTPTKYRETGINDIFSVQEYELNGRRLKSYSQAENYDSSSRNFNVELNYDNGGDFTSTVRAVVGHAKQSYINSYADIDLAQGSQWMSTPVYPSGEALANPNGYTGLITSVVNYEGDHPSWTLPDITNDVNAYALGALSSENNYDREADLKIVRFDGKYLLDGFFTSFEAGVRLSARDAKNDTWDMVAPLYAGNGASDPNGCLVKWKATDVQLNNAACYAGSGTFGEDDFVAYTAGAPTPLTNFGDDVIAITDFGGTSVNNTVYTLDPKAMDDVWGFHNKLYPGNQKSAQPGNSYAVSLDDLSYYAQLSFEHDASIPVSGNFGLRVIQTRLTVTQNTVGAPQQYGVAAGDTGDLVTVREYTDVLPSLNISASLSNNLKLRAAYAKAMTPLDLIQWGGGLSTNYALNGDTGIREIIGANSTGNPDLDPWRSDNYDLSLEYYPGEASQLSAGIFLVEVESFPTNGTVVRNDLPDQDGIVRRSVNMNTTVNGGSGTLKGLELAAKISLSDFIDDGFLTNFGIDTNYTYSPSESDAVSITGEDLPFPENSEHQYNLIGWYQNDALQVRIAYNYRSERYLNSNAGWSALDLWQEETAYIDASVSYDVNDDISVYLNGSNITGEYEDYYYQWADQHAYQNIYEPRYTLGLRAKF